jgi:hypothetical protein
MCVRANVNILSLYGTAIPYNTCRNLEWQVLPSLSNPHLPNPDPNLSLYAT